MGQTEPVSGNVMELVKRGQIHDLRGCQGTESKLSAGEANLRGLCARGGQRAYPQECGETGEPEAIRERALNAYRERYGDCGPTCAAEKPAGAEGIRIREDTLRRWLIAAGRWKGKRRRRAYRSRRVFGRTGCFSKKLGNHWKAFNIAFFYINYGYV